VKEKEKKTRNSSAWKKAKSITCRKKPQEHKLTNVNKQQQKKHKRYVKTEDELKMKAKSPFSLRMSLGNPRERCYNLKDH